MSWQQNYGCMFPGSSCRTWIETDGSNLIWCSARRLSYHVLPSYLAGRSAGQAQSAKLLINTPCCILDGAGFTGHILGVLCPYVFTGWSAHD